MTAARILGVTIAVAYLAALLLALAVACRASARAEPLPGTAAQDEAAIDALSPADEQLLGEWRAHLDQLTGPFDPDTTKDQP